MRGVSGALSVAIAALLVVCNADPNRDSEANQAETVGYNNVGGEKTRNLDPIGGGNLVRQVRDTGHGFIPYLVARPRYYGTAGVKRELWPMPPARYGGYFNEGYPKRNFDEIDLSGLDHFVNKKNMDEIDQTSMPFPYAKRYYRPIGPNHSYMSSFDKKRYRADYPMDEIDLSHFPIGSKRSQGTWLH